MPKLDNKVLVLILVLYFGWKNFPAGGLDLGALKKYLPTSSVTETVVLDKGRVVSEPSAELKKAADSTTTRDKRGDAIAVGDFMGDFNKIILAKDGLIQTSQQLKDTFKAVGKGYIQTVGYTKDDYPLLGNELDAYLDKTLGLENTVIDKNKASAALTALQWSLYQVGK
jgi:hypothetical protein